MNAAGDDPGAGESAWPADAIEVGRIGGAWGVKGELRVLPYAAEPQALLRARQWFVRPPDAAAHAPQARLLTILRARSHGDGVVAQAREISDRDAAQALQGCSIHLPRAAFPKTAKDEWYWVDLIGLAVINRDGAELGQVVGLLDTGAHSVLRVQPLPDGAERLIPFVDAYVDAVDLAARSITVDWGLDY